MTENLNIVLGPSIVSVEKLSRSAVLSVMQGLPKGTITLSRTNLCLSEATKSKLSRIHFSNFYSQKVTILAGKITVVGNRTVLYPHLAFPALR